MSLKMHRMNSIGDIVSDEYLGTKKWWVLSELTELWYFWIISPGKTWFPRPLDVRDLGNGEKCCSAHD